MGLGGIDTSSISKGLSGYNSVVEVVVIFLVGFMLASIVAKAYMRQFT